LSEHDLIQAEIRNLSIDLKLHPSGDLYCRRAALSRRLAILRNDTSLLAESLQDCNSAIQLEPVGPVAWMERGLTHTALNKHDEAISDYTQSLKIEESSVVFYNRAVARWSAYQRQHENASNKFIDSSGVIEAVIQDYDMALELDPSLTDAHYNKGTVLMRLEEYLQARLEFDKCIEVNAEDFLAYFNRALCLEHKVLPRYSDKNALKEAIEDYGRTLRIVPDYLPALFNRATCHEMIDKKGRYANEEHLLLAIRDYDRIINEEPSNALAIYNRGWALEHLGRVEQAIADYERFLGVSDDGFAVGQLSVHLKLLLARQN
jgi:tetratricopeptide (TPR) repeat protein